MCRRFVVVLARSAAFVLFSGIYVRFFGICFLYQEKKLQKSTFISQTLAHVFYFA